MPESEFARLCRLGLSAALQSRHLTSNSQRLAFANRVAGVKLDPWQQEVLLSAQKRVLLNCARQNGKSTVAALVAAHTAIYAPGSLILLTSPTERQSKELFSKIRDVLRTARVELTDDNKKECITADRSRIVSLPGSPENIRGFSAPSMIIIDEAAFSDDELFFAAEPMLNTSRGAFWLLSTPYGKRGEFYRRWEKGEGWHKVKATAADCPRIEAKTIAEAKRDMPPGKFAQEFMCEFVETDDQVFGAATIDKAIDGSFDAWQL